MLVWSNYPIDLDIANGEGMASFCSGQIPALEISNLLGHEVGKTLYNQILCARCLPVSRIFKLVKRLNRRSATEGVAYLARFF